MNLIECPNTANLSKEDVRVFLGGGISNCPDWQAEMIGRFVDMDSKFTLMNPRRASFDVSSVADSDFQIEWEYFHLSAADAVIFWFPYNTLCPITLYELGVHAAMDTTIFVGCHPAYPRKFDVEKQLSLIRPDVTVHDNFAPLVQDVKDWYASVRAEW